MRNVRDALRVCSSRHFCFSPKSWLNAKFKYGLNEAANIVTQHFTKSLIDLRWFGLASQGDSKPRLDHVERGFDVRAFVVALHEALRVVAVKVGRPRQHLPEQSPSLTRDVRFVITKSSVGIGRSMTEPAVVSMPEGKSARAKRADKDLLLRLRL